MAFKEANDAVTSGKKFLAKIVIIKCFRVAVNSYVPIFWGLDACVVAEN